MVRIESLLRVALVTSLTAAVVAQTTVPAPLLGVEGGGGTGIPFGSSLACRYQCIYDAGTLPWSGPRVITGVSVRPDFNNGDATPAKGFLVVSVLVSTTSRTAATASTVFAENYGSDATWVIEDRIVQLPAQPMIAAGSGPRPANIDFTFDVPWAYGLTPVTVGQPVADGLVVEVWIKEQPNGIYRIDNYGSCTSTLGAFGSIGPACSFGGNQVELTSGETMLAGSSYSWQVSQAPPNVPFFLLMDLTDQGELFDVPGWTLPYPMFDPSDPTQPSDALQLFGQSAPDCYFNVDLAFLVAGTTDSNGQAVVTSVLPAESELVDATFYSQALVYAPTSNPLRWITSAGHSSTVCGPLGVARIVQFYDGAGLPAPPPPATGSVSLGVGMVLDVY